MGGLVSMAGPQSGLLPGPAALCGDSQPLIPGLGVGVPWQGWLGLVRTQ